MIKKEKLIKTSYIFTFMFIFLLPLSWSYALSNTQKWAVLEKFKQKQYDLLFESDLWDVTSEFWDIFDISKKVDIYEKVSNKAKEDREDKEIKNQEILKKITSLEESIKQLDIDIDDSVLRIKKINENIINTKAEIESNTKTIDILQKKIAENKEILLEYLIYTYKKQNTVYENEQVDNLKSILLNEENIWDVINDLYFKWIIQVTWDELINKHRKYINDLYVKKVKLDKQEENLKKLRKLWVIEKKTLDDKRAFKGRILEISKWKQAFYEKYISDKIQLEKNLQMKAFTEKLKMNSIRDWILAKNNCQFIDLSKDIPESEKIDWKCLDINKMFYSESKLSWVETSTWNFLQWPISPDKWITAFFHDISYTEMFWSAHEAIDIKADQWTPIKAPADWYVIYLQSPTSQDYSYMAIKHYDWYVTVYWHLSDIFVKQYDYVKKWDIFALTWWAVGTLWAWFLTTWAHLHFEVMKDKEYIDPLDQLDLSFIRYTIIPWKYKNKFYDDFKSRKWYEFKNKSENSMTFKIVWDNEIERQQNFIKKYAVWDFNNWQMWVDESLAWNIDPSFVMCIWLAETGLWKHLKTPYNVWNIWNTDSWAVRTFPNARSWVSAMVRTLNNKYLSQYNQVNMLSRYWNDNPKKPIYASSPYNWHNNIIKCLSHIKWTYIPDDYNFRWDN